MLDEGPAGGKDFSYLDIGWRMLGAVATGLLGGWLVKRWIHADWPLVVGGVVGIAVGMYELILLASRTEKRPKG
jgi:hypothetical protein